MGTQLASDIIQQTLTNISTLIGSIDFNGKPLSTFIVINDRAITTTPNTQVQVFGSLGSPEYIENRLMNSIINVTIRIRCKQRDRQVQAQIDMNLIEKEIMEILQNNHTNAFWGAGYLDTRNIESIEQNYLDNYLTKEITFAIKRRVSVD